VCGSRTWSDQMVIRTVLRGLVTELAEDREPVTIVHGAAAGADQLADDVARDLQLAGWDVTIEAHPAQWAAYGKGAGPIRNQEMADAGADLCVGFSGQPVTRGTADMIGRATKAGIRVWVIGHGVP
jgi:YspA, cpYpsA-related SLOG family